MDEKSLITIYGSRPHLLHHTLGQRYRLEQFPIQEQFLHHLDPAPTIVVLDLYECDASELKLIEKIKCVDGLDAVPIVVIHSNTIHESRLQAFELGCDDYLDASLTEEELALHCEKLIYNKIANDQLQAQVKQATELAFIAMSDTSDLGINIQFLLDVHQCDNLDELGMRLLQAISSYGLKASLQIRSELGVKNMDMSGIPKELESALMWELKDDGRYIDFGRRSVMNYEHVSLLVKNMPVDDEKKYGALKDNIFSLLQGVEARLIALENIAQVNEQTELVKTLSLKMQKMMEGIDDGYQGVMKEIADVVENMSDGINEIIVNLALHEEQEKALEKVMDYGVKSTNVIFAEGLKLDESFQNVVKQLGGFLSADSSTLTTEQRQEILALLYE